jgi:osmoprotectant transport system ATP-binding protein
VGVARALAADPPILLCDEPFGAVDPLARQELQIEFRSLAERLGKTLVFVTHDVREAVALASRIALLDQGRLVFAGTVEEFSTTHEPRVTALRGLL